MTDTLKKLFHAGWRPAIGWLGVAIIFWHYLALPAGQWVAFKMGADLTGAPMPLNPGDLWPVVAGMLGVAGMRSFDKKQGTAKA